MPKWSNEEYGLGYTDGMQDADLGIDKQWSLLGTEYYDTMKDDAYWIGYHDGRWSWADKRQLPEWEEYFV